MDPPTLAVIGFSGRKVKLQKLTPQTFQKMEARVMQERPSKLVSGGSAWADHVAVSLFLQRKVEGLELHLPCQFADEFDVKTPEGRILNGLHQHCSTILGVNTLSQLELAIA